MRDIDKREVDFLIVKNNQPWFSIKAKTSMDKSMKNLIHFHQQLKTTYDLQVVKNMDFVQKSCFEKEGH